MYRWVEHTGELELEIEAADEVAVFGDGVAALHELLKNDRKTPTESRELDVTAPDRATLLAEFMTELLFFVEMEDFVPTELSTARLEEQRLRATVHGYRGHPPHLVKAVTYHRLCFAPTSAGWRASLVLDV